MPSRVKIQWVFNTVRSEKQGRRTHGRVDRSEGARREAGVTHPSKSCVGSRGAWGGKLAGVFNEGRTDLHSSRTTLALRRALGHSEAQPRQGGGTGGCCKGPNHREWEQCGQTSTGPGRDLNIFLLKGQSLVALDGPGVEEDNDLGAGKDWQLPFLNTSTDTRASS